MREKELTEPQKQYIRTVIDSLKFSTDLELKHNPEVEGLEKADAEVANAVIGLVFHRIVKKEQNGSESGLDREDVRRLSGTLINNAPGSRNLYDHEHGFEHSTPGHSRNGRNHTGRVKAGR